MNAGKAGCKKVCERCATVKGTKATWEKYSEHVFFPEAEERKGELEPSQVFSYSLPTAIQCKGPSANITSTSGMPSFSCASPDEYWSTVCTGLIDAAEKVKLLLRVEIWIRCKETWCILQNRTSNATFWLQRSVVRNHMKKLENPNQCPIPRVARCIRWWNTHVVCLNF